MQVFRIASLWTLLLIFSSMAGVAYASFFPDVPDGHIYQEPIEALVQTNIINGNPDGTFAPDRVVNRAEMLKMLYKAKGRMPDPLSIRCFKDVEIGSWYEPYICDAAARRYINGYSDGTFRPGNPVNRVEALKMIAEVFELPVQEITEEDRDVVNFVDVSIAAWYTKYLYLSYAKGILPIAGQEGSRFYPDWPLLRGESAAYIYNALRVDLTESRRQKEKSSSSTAAEQASSNNTSQQVSSHVPTSLDVSFPFEHSRKFDLKKAFSYRFNIPRKITASVHVKLQTKQPGTVSCRLYLLDENGFSDEYFLGYQEKGECFILATLNPGSYQLQLQPSEPGTTYDVSAKEGTGDGNDGFADAKLLTLNLVHTETIAASDFADWYTFSLSSQQKLTVELSNSPSLSCIVYAMSDVNLESFTGPQCNQGYTYPPGTYFVAVGRKSNMAAQQTYTIRLDK